MDIFRKDGHLSETSLTALMKNEPLDELHRLEMAEHLAWCDLCLQRYTDALSGQELLVPLESCRENVWRRIQARTLRILTSRYAAAAAAVAVALTVVWGSRDFPVRISLPDGPSWTETCSATLDDAREKFDNFFDRLEEARFENMRRNDL